MQNPGKREDQGFLSKFNQIKYPSLRSKNRQHFAARNELGKFSKEIFPRLHPCLARFWLQRKTIDGHS